MVSNQTREVVGFSVAAGIFCMVVYALYKNFLSDSTKPKGLDERKYQKYKLTKITKVSHNTRIFRFALQTPTTILGLPTGSHISFRFFDKNNEEHRRPYTPITSNDDKGYFEMMIKIYEGGKMTQHLESLKLGDYIEARGPQGRIHYDAPGHFIIKKGSKRLNIRCTKLGLICGGTGITPMLQLIRQIIKDENDDTEVNMIFGNVSIDDILLENELKKIRQNHKNIKIFFTIDKGPTDGREWNEGVGYITKDMISNNIFEPSNDVAVFLCGPPIMTKILEKTMTGMGYNPERIIKY